MSKPFNTLDLGAWELIQDVEYKVFSLLVPTPWRQVAQTLASERASKGYSKFPSVPVSSLDQIISASFPQIIHTSRYAWQLPGVPWIFATEKVDISHLPEFIKDWLREEFDWCLGEDLVNSRLEQLNNKDWCWEKKTITNPFWNEPKSDRKVDFRFQILPNFIAKEFLQEPTVCFEGENIQYQLTFYPVVRLKQGAELMSFPPCRVPLFKEAKKDGIKQVIEVDEAYISFVITFKLQTVPWRKEPMIYHQLSIRRWITKPIEKLPCKGATAYIGDNHRWLDGLKQPFTFIPLKMKRLGKRAKWHKAISELLKINGSPLPEPEDLAKQPKYNWSEFGENLTGTQIAIPYDTRHPGDAPCFPGVSPRDLASLDKAIQERLSDCLHRVGEAKLKAKGINYWQISGQPKTPMLRPEIAAPAVFRSSETSPHTILILWETEECRDALIAEICRLLYLSPSGETKTYQTIIGVEGEESIYSGQFGTLSIKTQFIQDLINRLDVDIQDKNRQKKRESLIEERIQQIILYIPKSEVISGAIIEIKSKKSYFPPESDPKLALRIGVMQAGYVNQYIHAITATNKKTGEEYTTSSATNRIQRAVSDLLRQFGIVPAPLIDPEKDDIDVNSWLTCFYVLRRTRKTTANNKATTVVLMVRVNLVKGIVEITTPSLFPAWLSYPSAMKYLIAEKWEPNSYADETSSEEGDEQQLSRIKQEQQIMNKFVNDCLRDCLNTPIEQGTKPRVLFMAEAQNARKLLTWLQNPELPRNELPKALDDLTESEKNRLWVVRLRVANNGEVPVGIVKDNPGGKRSGVFDWENVCDKSESSIYLSSRKPLTTEQGKNTLQKRQSRLDNGNRQAGNPKLLEIAVVHHPGIEADKLAGFVHNLRNRWPYFADDVSLPFPFPFATLTKEYAVSAKDTVESEALEESGDLEE
ncbi:hypothetical protein CEN39_06230 [Fischerella thermalis CCMEE 5201]|nr:hypothetical protein CEN39_06230 [Fischerella thermalis CCMEE 5201]